MYSATDKYPQFRQTIELSTERQKQLEEKLAEIESWVYNPCSEKRLAFEIESNSLKKAIDKQVKRQYLGSGVFFEFQRGVAHCEVKKKDKMFN